jgi:hypothetical protein
MAKRNDVFKRSVAVAAAIVLTGCGAMGAGPAAKRAAGDLGAMAAGTRSQVVVHFKDRTQLERIAASGVDLFENVDHDKKTVGATLTAQTKQQLDKLGVRYEVVRVKQALGFPQGYGSVEAVHAELRQLAQAYPKLMTVVEYGKSLEGRPLLAAKLTSKPGEALPAVRLQGGNHARELVPVELMRNLTKLLVEGYGKDATATRLLDTREVWIVPIVNPDGRVRVEKGSDMWRKNARPLGLGANGVDINRNADDHWDGGNGSKWADDYKGEAPFSEPETQGLRDLSLKVKFKASIDVHCYGGMLLWPPGYSNELSADEPTFRTIGDKMAKPLGYRAGTIARTIYKTFGDFATWEYAKLNTLAFACELDDRQFGPGFGQVEKDWTGWKNNFLYLIDAAGNPKAQHPNEARFLGFNGL